MADSLPAGPQQQDVLEYLRCWFSEWEIGPDSSGNWGARLMTSEGRPQPRIVGADPGELTLELIDWHAARGLSLPRTPAGDGRIGVGVAIGRQGLSPELTEEYLHQIQQAGHVPPGRAEPSALPPNHRTTQQPASRAVPDPDQARDAGPATMSQIAARVRQSAGQSRGTARRHPRLPDRRPRQAGHEAGG